MTIHELREWGRRPAPLWVARAVWLFCMAVAGAALGVSLARVDLADRAVVGCLVLAWLFGLAAGALRVAALWRPWGGGQ
jgi:hypothetical protein